MNELNIFDYSPKELTTDALLTYWFLWCEKHKLTTYLRALFFGDRDYPQTDFNIVAVSRQVSFGKKRADLVVEINVGEAVKWLVFENKTCTSTTTEQLVSYQTDDGAYSYKYLKLGYLNNYERLLCAKHGYTTISGQELYDAISAVASVETDDIINQYQAHLLRNYVNPVKEIKRKFREGDIQGLLHDKDGQRYAAEMFAQRMGKLELDRSRILPLSNLYFIQAGSSSGRPWTEIVFIEACCGESIFWRFDIRAGKHYIRLNQYSRSRKQTPEHQEAKRARLLKYRAFARKYCDEHSTLACGKLSHRGENEREVIIFFFEENDLEVLLAEIPLLTKAFRQFYYDLHRGCERS